MTDAAIEPLQVDVAHAGGTASVKLGGELDIFTAGHLQLALEGALQKRDTDRVVVDLADVAFIDVRGIDCLIHLASDCRQRGVDFAVRHPSRSVIRIERLARIDDSLLPLERCE